MDLTILKQRKPQVALFLEEWCAKNERKTFDLSNDSDQADFYEALMEMGKHIAHVSTKVTLATVLSVDGVTTLYVNAVPSQE